MSMTIGRSIGAASGRVVSVLLMTMLLASSVLANQFELVTAGEYAESIAAGENPSFEFVAKAVPGGPQIRVLAPLLAADVLASPIDIEVAFEPSAGATIDMSSLKIYYLMFIKKDVTKRIMEHATVGTGFIRAEGAELPSGEHKFLIEIHDSERRMGSQKIVVNVKD